MNIPGRKQVRRKVPIMGKDFVGPGFYVLLALAESPAYQAELQRRIVGITVGKLISNSTLHDEIARLEKTGFVSIEQGSWPKIIYLTTEGERILRLRTGDLQAVLQVARQRGLAT